MCDGRYHGARVHEMETPMPTTKHTCGGPVFGKRTAGCALAPRYWQRALDSGSCSWPRVSLPRVSRSTDSGGRCRTCSRAAWSRSGSSHRRGTCLACGCSSGPELHRRSTRHSAGSLPCITQGEFRGQPLNVGARIEVSRRYRRVLNVIMRHASARGPK